MVAVAKHIIVRAPDGEVEHFHGEDLTALVETDGSLWIQERDNSHDGSWEYSEDGSMRERKDRRSNFLPIFFIRV